MALISALTRSLTNIKPSSALSSGLRPGGLARGHQVRGVTVSRLPVHHLDMGPDRSLACVVAFSSSHGEDLQDLYSGWHLVKPRNLVCMYCREGRVSALHLSCLSQYSCTAALVAVLTWCLDGTEESQVRGCGTPYCGRVASVSKTMILRRQRQVIID